ncbi:hypothetical protein [Flavobacterium sp. NRK F7]|uniref:hypothetical protein n=1 Tax=Flavobacterium sp. NRK F7 TaxID=2954930 RepID=UPI002090F18C|nr:hypothetical protein [Flavobacterium sp. NRK F7]MCO6162571.1 hypothetical protein [Flavobacterium sp. NRK F7]
MINVSKRNKMLNENSILRNDFENEILISIFLNQFKNLQLSYKQIINVVNECNFEMYLRNYLVTHIHIIKKMEEFPSLLSLQNLQYIHQQSLGKYISQLDFDILPYARLFAYEVPS